VEKGGTPSWQSEKAQERLATVTYSFLRPKYPFLFPQEINR